MPAITSRVCPLLHGGLQPQHLRREPERGQHRAFPWGLYSGARGSVPQKPERENGKHISIVGSGPAGLTAACYLRQSGYRVTVYEKQKEAGGCLSYAIPGYRLPKEIVRRFVGALEHMGVAFRCGCSVGTDIQLEEIYQNSDGVMLDTGTWKRPLIGLAGEELTRFGLEFLVDVNNYILEKPGSDVVVVGGGNVAMDVAITAKRLGAPM